MSGTFRQGVYRAFEWGVIGLSEAEALDYAARGMRVNTGSPESVAMPMMQRLTGGKAAGRQKVVEMKPIGRVRRPGEIAATILWLYPDEAGFATGAHLIVDGG